MNRPITKATPEDAGCYVDSHWGQYGVAHMIDVAAKVFGYSNTEAENLAARHLATMGPFNPDADEPLSKGELWLLVDLSAETEQWLNDNVAPQDYWFGWHDGEFFLQSTDWWNEDSQL